MPYLLDYPHEGELMDPDITLAMLRVARVQFESSPEHSAAEQAAALDIAESARALDEWLSQGGFLPEDWKRSEREAASKLRDVRIALAKYGGHTAGCAQRRFDRSYPELDCTCGFTEALGTLS